VSTLGTRHIIWQGGEHDFCLGAAGDILMLEQNCNNSGIAEIYHRLSTGLWRLNDVRETIRLGLTGGGMSPDIAMQLVKTAVDGNPRGLAPSAVLAQAVLEAVIAGVPDDPVGKSKAAEAETGQVSSTTTAASAAQPSSASAPPLAGRRRKPTAPASGK
jgi:hypothetical protein